MAHLADELDHAAAERLADGGDQAAGGAGVPDIVNDPRALRVVPWAGDGPDPLADVEAGP